MLLTIITSVTLSQAKEVKCVCVCVCVRERERKKKVCILTVNKLKCCKVKGDSHIAVFIAGATMIFLFSSGVHALTTHDRRLSHNPWASFANVLADSGAIIKTSAHFLSSIWRTSSPSFQSSGHSSLAKE